MPVVLTRDPSMSTSVGMYSESEMRATASNRLLSSLAIVISLGDFSVRQKPDLKLAVQRYHLIDTHLIFQMLPSHHCPSTEPR